MKKSVILSLAALSLLSSSSAFAYKCPLTQAGPAENLRNQCGTISGAAGSLLFAPVSGGRPLSIAGTDKAKSAELTKLADGKTIVCVDVCSSENDFDVYNIVSPQ